MLLVFFIAFCVFYGVNLIALLMIGSFYNDGLNNSRWHYSKILEFIGVKYIRTQPWGSYIYHYSLWFCFLHPLIYLIALINLLNNNTVYKIIKKQELNTEKKKRYITLDQIYQFKKGDLVKFKTHLNLTNVYLESFSANQFTDKNGAIYDWSDVFENTSFNTRSSQNKNNIKLAVFKKDADSFQQKVEDFQKEMENQYSDIIKKIEDK